MIIKNEVMLSGDYNVSYLYGLEKKEGGAKTTTVYVIGSPSEKTIRLEALQYQSEGDDLFYYSDLAELERFSGYNLKNLANRLFYYCTLWTGTKREISDFDAEKIKAGIFDVLAAIEKLNS